MNFEQRVNLYLIYATVINKNLSCQNSFFGMSFTSFSMVYAYFILFHGGNFTFSNPKPTLLNLNPNDLNSFES